MRREIPHRVATPVPKAVVAYCDQPAIRALLVAQITLEAMRYYLEQEEARWSRGSNYTRGWNR